LQYHKIRSNQRNITITSSSSIQALGYLHLCKTVTPFTSSRKSIYVIQRHSQETVYLASMLQYQPITLGLHLKWGRDSSVGIAMRYGLDGQRIESQWGRDFPHPSRRPWDPPTLRYNGYRNFPGGKAAGAWR
jgi:hypothetical protein